LSTKDLAGSLCQNLFLSNQDLEDEQQPQLQIPQLYQINPTTTSLNQSNDISMLQLYYHDASIKLGDGGWSEEKRPKIREVGVGQRRRGAMLSV
jgi:hypothetical protein